MKVLKYIGLAAIAFAIAACSALAPPDPTPLDKAYVFGGEVVAVQEAALTYLEVAKPSAPVAQAIDTASRYVERLATSVLTAALEADQAARAPAPPGETVDQAVAAKISTFNTILAIGKDALVKFRSYLGGG